MRLETELRATRRGWWGRWEVTLAGSPLAPVHCCLHQVEALTITHPSVSPAVPAAIWKLGQVSVWAPRDVGHTLGHTRESFCS